MCVLEGAFLVGVGLKRSYSFCSSGRLFGVEVDWELDWGVALVIVNEGFLVGIGLGNNVVGAFLFVGEFGFWVCWSMLSCRCSFSVACVMVIGLTRGRSLLTHLVAILSAAFQSSFGRDLSSVRVLVNVVW